MDGTNIFWLFLTIWSLRCQGRVNRELRSACDSAPCQNGGQCIDITYPGGPIMFKCACKEGYDGLTCQRRIDPCAEEPCENGGVCSQRGEHYHCTCPEAFKGKNCDEPLLKNDPCSMKPCGVHGVCEIVSGQVVCECLPGYSGAKCETSDGEPEIIAVESTSSQITSWVIRNLLITILFFVILFGIILFFLCVHCCRVWNRHSALKAIKETNIAQGLDPGKTVGWMEISNDMCYNFFCCCIKKPHTVGLGERCYADPDNITGVIVPLRDYNTMVLNGYRNDYMAPDNVPMDPALNNMQMARDQRRFSYPSADMNTLEPSRGFSMGPSAYIPKRRHAIVPGGSQMLYPSGSSEILPDYTEEEDLQKYRMWNSKPSHVTNRMSIPMPESSLMRNANANKAKKKVSRAELHAQHGRKFQTQTNSWYQRNPTSLPHGKGYPYHQVLNPAYIHPTQRLEPYPLHNNLSHGLPHPEYYSNGLPQTTPYPWIPQPYTYPTYGYTYPLQNNVQNDAYPLPVSAANYNSHGKKRSRGWLKSNSGYFTPLEQNPHLANESNESVDRHQQQMNQEQGINSDDSTMDKLEFVDDNEGDESELIPINESESESRSTYVESDTEDENLDRAVIDDDGYGSTSRLSENKVGGRNKDTNSPQSYSEKASRNYVPRKQRQRAVKQNRSSSRSEQGNTQVNNCDVKRTQLSTGFSEPYDNQLSSLEYTEPSNSPDSDERTSEEDKENYQNFEGPGAPFKECITTKHPTYRTQQQLDDEEYNTGRLIRRGDLWNSSHSKQLGSQKHFINKRSNDILGCRTSLKFARQSPTSSPKKVKGILKNICHEGNYNRSASSRSPRKSKKICLNRLSSRRRSMRYVDESDETD